MNFYFLIAIALGAIGGLADVPVARPLLASVVSERAVRRDVRAARAAAPLWRHASTSTIGRFLPTASAARPDAPLTGAASPRAPAPLPC